MPSRGIRGAITVAENTPDAILEATRELLEAIVAANSVRPEDIASAIFTVTPDLTEAFPPAAAREMGWHHVPLLTAVEMDAPNGLPRCIRTLIHWNTERPIYDIRHVYLRDAVRLRPDLAGEYAAAEPAPAPEEPPASRSFVSSGVTTVAFQGEPGANSQVAIYQQFGKQVNTLPCAAFERNQPIPADCGCR